jgi:hypothetical protein
LIHIIPSAWRGISVSRLFGHDFVTKGEPLRCTSALNDKDADRFRIFFLIGSLDWEGEGRAPFRFDAQRLNLPKANSNCPNVASFARRS